MSPCGKRCCRSDYAGDFTKVEPLVGRNTDRYEYQPTYNSCRYEEINRGQLLHYLHSTGSPLVVMGDSMMRQFSLRLVMMIRGQKRLLDYHQHTHAHYAVCKEADMFRISTNNSNRTSHEPLDDHLVDKIPSFFFGLRNGPGYAAGARSLQACSRPPAKIHYLHAPTFESQWNYSIPQYMLHNPPGVKPIMLLSVGYWQPDYAVHQEYLDALVGLIGRVRRVFIISVPTIRVVQPERLIAYRLRNAFMKGWVNQMGEPFVFVDYDAMSASPHPPPGGADNNWHYMCSIGWNIRCNQCKQVMVDHDNGIDEDGNLIPQIVHGKVEKIMSTEDESCTDEMNRNLWQVVLNTLIPPASSDDDVRQK